jgi:hypothetical protein
MGFEDEAEQSIGRPAKQSNVDASYAEANGNSRQYLGSFGLVFWEVRGGGYYQSMYATPLNGGTQKTTSELYCVRLYSLAARSRRKYDV